MEAHTQNLEAEIEAIKEAYAALNRGDIEGFVKDFDSQIVRIEFEGTPMAGTYRGIDEVREHVIKGRSTWAEGGCEPTGFTVAGDKVVVSCHVRVRLKDQTDWLEGHTGDVFTFRNGKAVEFRTFTTEKEALEFAVVPRI
jgi:ketosteroid isomerase-like protein